MSLSLVPVGGGNVLTSMFRREGYAEDAPMECIVAVYDLTSRARLAMQRRMGMFAPLCADSEGWVYVPESRDDNSVIVRYRMHYD